MESKKHIGEILSRLEQRFPDADTELNFDGVFQLLCAVILSAQCTDKRVNAVTEQLFKVAPTAREMAALPVEEIEKIIFSCGFYRSKANFLKAASTDILQRFDGSVPDNKKDLKSLKGVGEKTASVVFAVGLGGQAVAVDTHVFRVAGRLGLSEANNPDRVQKDLERLIPQQKWSKSHHLLLLFGRYVCKSQNPKCRECFLTEYCHNVSKGRLNV